MKTTFVYCHKHKVSPQLPISIYTRTRWVFMSRFACTIITGWGDELSKNGIWLTLHMTQVVSCQGKCLLSFKVQK